MHWSSWMSARMWPICIKYSFFVNVSYSHWDTMATDSSLLCSIAIPGLMLPYIKMMFQANWCTDFKYRGKESTGIGSADTLGLSKVIVSRDKKSDLCISRFIILNRKKYEATLALNQWTKSKVSPRLIVKSSLISTLWRQMSVSAGTDHLIDFTSPKMTVKARRRSYFGV